MKAGEFKKKQRESGHRSGPEKPQEREMAIGPGGATLATNKGGKPLAKAKLLESTGGEEKDSGLLLMPVRRGGKTEVGRKGIESD